MTLLRKIVGFQVGDRVRLTEHWVESCHGTSQDFWRSCRFVITHIAKLNIASLNPPNHNLLHLRLESCSVGRNNQPLLKVGVNITYFEEHIELADD